MRILIFLFVFLFGANASEDIFGRSVDTSDTSKLYFFGPGSLRVATYLGLENRLVGIDEFDTKTPHLAPYRQHLVDKNITTNAKIISVGGPGKLPSKEAVMKSGASLIIMCDYAKDIVEEFAKSIDIPVFAINYTLGVKGNELLDSAKKSITLVSEITNTQERAKKLLSFLSEQEKALKELNAPKSKIYIGGLGYKGAHGITSSVNYFPSFELLGLKNSIAQSVMQNQITISYEALIKEDPEFIFIDKSGKKLFDDEKKGHEDVFNELSAFKNGKVFVLEPYNQYATNLENVYINAWQIAKILGVDVDFEAKKSEILKAFFGE